jgi:O-antigen/teichoic acid export membrane protein
VSRQVTHVPQANGSRRNLTILDQIIVSGSNFATGIILVRGLGLSKFGIFTIGYSILMLANSIQLSFISAPMITLGSLCSTFDEKRRFVQGMFGAQIIFCAITSVAVLATALVYLGLNRGAATTADIVAFVTAVAAYLMQDWLRRYYFTVDRAPASVWNDSISYLGQVILLCLLMRMQCLTIETVFWTIAITSAFAFALGALLERLRCNLAEVRDAWRQCARISINLGISNQLQWLVYQGAILIGASIAGVQAAGGVRATQNAIGPVNIAFQAMENIVPIRAAEEMRRGGVARVTAFLFRFGLSGFIVLLIAFSLASLVSGKFLYFVYGHQLSSYARVLDLQMLYFLLAWPIRQLNFLFRTIKDTTPILISSIVAAVISLSFIYPMIRKFDAIGIVMAAVAGQLGNLLYLLLALVRVRLKAQTGELNAQADPS